MQNENQNLPAEYAPVLSMVKKEDSLRIGIQSMKSKIMTAACEEFNKWPVEKQDRFIERAIIEIAKDDKLAPCFESPEGKLSILKAFECMVSTCLEIGGKHAYLVPQPRNSKRKGKDGKDIWVTEVRFSIKDVGYIALLCGGKYPIFKEIRFNQVYEKEADRVIIDSGTGEVRHPEFIGDDKGAFIGCWVQIVKMNDKADAKFFPLKKIYEWRNNSDAYQYAMEKINDPKAQEWEKNKAKDSAWLSWNDEMALQACIRHMCSKYEKARELLQSAIYDDDEKQDEPEKTSVEKIDEALIKPNTPPAEEKPAEKQKSKKTASNSGDLFDDEKKDDPLEFF